MGSSNARIRSYADGVVAEAGSRFYFFHRDWVVPHIKVGMGSSGNVIFEKRGWERPLLRREKSCPSPVTPWECILPEASDQ